MVSQQLLLLSTIAATPYNTFYLASGPASEVIGIDRRCMAMVLGDMFMQVSFSIKAPRSSFIYVCIRAPKISYFQGASAGAQRCSTAPETLACRHLEWHLRNQKLKNIKTRTKEISISLRIISLAASKSCFVQCFLFTVYRDAQRIAYTFSLDEWQVLG